MKKILAYWSIILIIYGILLALIGNYEALSVFYHLALLLFPLGLILFKIETFRNLGFKKGNTKEGILWLSFILIALVGGTYLRAFLSDKSVSLVFDFSLLFILIITLTPISEEIFHRGLLQTKLEKKYGETIGLILPSILFAFIHVPKLLFAKDYVSASTPLLPALSNPIMSLFLFFVFGMLFGYIYQGTKSIYYSIGGHALFNLIIATFIY